MPSTITVEVEYTPPERDVQITQQWSFEGVTPKQAKERVVREYVPGEATLWRVGLWHGTPKDRPDGGHETGILQKKGDEMHPKEDQNHTLDQF